ncbi:MAG: clostripain-related cysteine peptidase [Firmicutes bacterium]|nr:clostripain-related cysteine peptidase [Bacillota bacterium]
MERKLRNYIVYIIPVLVLILAAAAGCGAGSEAASIGSESSSSARQSDRQVSAAEPAEWTLLIYMAADNDLETAAWQDLQKLETIGSNEKVNVVVQWDNKGQYGNKGTKRYYIRKNPNPKVGTVASPVEEDLGETDSSNPDELVNFLTWGMKKYPAKKYGVILWNHGSGWRSPSPDSQNGLKGICFDETANDNMTISELTDAFQSVRNIENKKIEFIGMDACLMGMTEVAYNLRDYSNYLTFCESSIYGWPYQYILEDLQANPSMDGKDLCGITVARFRQYWLEKGDKFMASISAIDLGKIDLLATSLDQFAASALENSDELKTVLGKTARETESIDEVYSDFKDLNLFMQNIITVSSNEAINAKARQVKDALKQTVIFETHGESFSPYTAGLTIWLPDKTKYSEFEDSYSLLSLSRNGLWDEFLDQIIN